MLVLCASTDIILLHLSQITKKGKTFKSQKFSYRNISFSITLYPVCLLVNFRKLAFALSRHHELWSLFIAIASSRLLPHPLVNYDASSKIRLGNHLVVVLLVAK